MNKARAFVLLLLVYLLSLALYRWTVDLPWMPPSPPLDASAKKRNPDGPLIVRDDFLDEKSPNVLSAIALLDPDGNGRGKKQKNYDVKIKKPDLKEKKLALPEVFLKKFKATAKAIQKKTDGFVLLSLINAAYLNLTLNFLCNTYVLSKPNGDIHKSILIVSLDRNSCSKITRDWKNVSCLTLTSDPYFNQELPWGRHSFIQLLRVRANLMAALSESKLPYVMFETDVIWLKNPIPLFTNSNLVEDADLVLPKNTRNEKGEAFLLSPAVVFPTTASRRALQELRRILNSKTGVRDQEVMNKLCSSQYMGLVCRDFQWEHVADGKWFRMSDAERRRLKPYVLNNNFYAGVRNKVARLTINGLWFLSPKGVCNSSKAKNLLNKHA